MVDNLLKDMLITGCEVQPPQKWPTYDGKELIRGEYITSSEIGKCARMIWFAKDAFRRGVVAENGINGFWERGHNVEAWIVDRILAGIAHKYADEYELLFAGNKQVSFHDGYQSGTPDAFLKKIGSNEGWTVDFKSMDPRKSVKKLPEDNHKDQVTQNCDLIVACTDLFPLGGKLLYVNCSDYLKNYEYTFDFDHGRADFLQERANTIKSAKKPKELPAEGLFNGDCEFCPFTANCSDMQRSLNVQKETMKNSKGLANEIFG